MDNNQQIIKDMISIVLDFLSVDYKINVEENKEDNLLVFNIETPDAQLLIGKDGENLKALQVLVKMMVYRKIDTETPLFSLDVNHYRQRRISFLKETTKSFADEVELTKKPITLQPMSSFERRIVHLEIIKRGGALETESIGEDFDRRVVIKPIS